MRGFLISLTMMAITWSGVVFGQQNRVLTDQQWRDDLQQLSAGIKDIHFKPFSEVTEADFDAAVTALSNSVSEKTDTEIIVEMTKIVALLRDGHTRLHIPRRYQQLALEAELGHGGTPPPHHEALKFDQLPVRFGLFSDGLFITAATPEHKHLIGSQVTAIGDFSAEEAIKRVKPTSFHENDSRANLIAPDRLALPQVLKTLGIVDDSQQITIRLKVPEKEEYQVSLKPMTGDFSEFVQGADISVAWLKNREQHEWFEVIPSNDAIYVQINQFAENPPRPYGVFVAETLKAASEAGVSRYIIDLRHNSGGIGAWTIPFLTGLSRSEFNEYGRLYILIGRTTFSAAQHFLHEFEEYTYAIFVGEPSGAKPSHYGDPRRVVLNHSGLTLRVSTIYWHSWLANDFREATNPHIDAPLASDDYFSGNDPALQAALSYQANPSIAEQIAEQLRKGKIQNGLLMYQRFITDGTISDHNQAIPELVDAGHGLLNDGITRPGYFVMLLTNNFFPGNPDVLSGLGRAHELMESPEEALAAYNEALEIDPDHEQASQGLKRVSPEQ